MISLSGDNALAVTCATGVFGFGQFNAMMTEATIQHCKNIWGSRGCRLDKLAADSDLRDPTAILAKAREHRKFEGVEEIRVGGDALADVQNNTPRPPFDAWVGQFDEYVLSGEVYKDPGIYYFKHSAYMDASQVKIFHFHQMPMN